MNALEKTLFLVVDRIPNSYQHLMLITAISIISFIIWRFIAFISSLFAPRQVEKKALNNAKRMRGAKKQTNQTFVRKTDIESTMSTHDRQIHTNALAKIQAGEFIEGALLLESIKFQRTAISTLEQHGFIDDAAKMLVRIGAIERAGVLYERNGDLLKAAEQYFIAKKYDKSGPLYFAAAHKDYRYYKKAQQSFSQIGDNQKILDCLEQLNEMQEFIALCLKTSDYRRLYQNLKSPASIYEIFDTLSYQQRMNLITTVELNPRGFIIIACWMNFLTRGEDKIMILNLVALHSNLGEHFWKSFHKNLLARHLKIFALISDHKVITAHASILSTIGYSDEAATLQKLAEKCESPPTISL